MTLHPLHNKHFRIHIGISLGAGCIADRQQLQHFSAQRLKECGEPVVVNWKSPGAFQIFSKVRDDAFVPPRQHTIQIFFVQSIQAQEIGGRNYALSQIRNTLNEASGVDYDSKVRFTARMLGRCGGVQQASLKP